MLSVRVIVLWVACSVISAEEDARWVGAETAKLHECDGVLDLAVHRVESAAVRYACQWDWCLELRVTDGASNAVVRHPVCAEFLADLRLLGTRPSVLVLPEGTETWRSRSGSSR
jgi:hypothetical protein